MKLPEEVACLMTGKWMVIIMLYKNLGDVRHVAEMYVKHKSTVNMPHMERGCSTKLITGAGGGGPGIC